MALETIARGRRVGSCHRAARPLTLRVLLAFAALPCLTAGCDFLEEGPELEQCQFQESTPGVTVQPSIDAADIGAAIGLIGQLNTPSPCHRLRASLEQSGSQLTVHVVASSTGSNCENVVGNFRYTCAIRNVSDGTYQLRVLHSFEGSSWEAYDFNVSVTVR